MAQLSEQERTKWLEERRTGIGGTDAAAILGFSPWSTALDVWLEKVGEVEPKEATEAMWWGSALEDLIAQRYVKQTGREVYAPPTTILKHPRHPTLLASIDRLVAGEKRGLDCKNSSEFMRHEWGPPGSDIIPDQYVVQCCHYMAVTGYPQWDVAALIGGNELRVYTLERDAEFEAAMVAKLTEWWETYVVGKVQPPITGTAGARAWIHKKFPQEHGPMMYATSEALEWMEKYRRARSARDLHQADLDAAENNLKNLIGPALGLEGPGFKVTWKGVQGRTSTAWEDFALALWEQMSIDQHDGITFAQARAKFEERGPGYRRFLYTQQIGKE